MDIADRRKLHDELLAEKPEGARHDADICPFCVAEAAQSSTTSRTSPDVSDHQSHNTEKKGGTSMSDISQEAHEALLAKAVKDATAATEKALETKTSELEAEKAKNTELSGKVTTLETDNARLNGELDSAQVAKKAAEDKAAQLEKDVAEQAKAAELAELASKRGEQVKNLGLYDEKFVTERASHWATLDEAEWTSRLEEWTKLKPADSAAKTTETASAMSGTSEELTKEKPVDEAGNSTPSARRAALGLV